MVKVVKCTLRWAGNVGIMDKIEKKMCDLRRSFGFVR